MGNKDKQQVKKGKKAKPLKWILKILPVIIILLAIAAMVAIPAYISSEGGRKTILARINESLEGRADFVSLSMGWFKGIKVTNFSFDDEAGLVSVRIKQINTRPHYVSLLAGDLSFGRTVIEQPKININMQKRPRPKQTKKQPAKQKEQLERPVTKIDLYINDGEITVSDSKNKSVRLENVNSHLDMKGQNKANKFAVDMTVANGADRTKFNAEGSVNPANSSGDLTIEVDDLDIATLAPLLDLANIEIQAKGRVTANIETEFSNAKIQKLSGTVNGSALDISGAALKGDRFVTSALRLDAQLKRDRDLMDIEKLNLTTDWAKISAAGQLPTTFDSLSQFISSTYDYSLDCDIEVDLPAATTQMPQTFKLKDRARITSGKLTAKISSSTQAGKRQISANAEVSSLAGLVNQRTVRLLQPIEAQVLITSMPSGINFDKIQVTSSFAQIHCWGTQKLLAYEASADLARLQNELGQFFKTINYKTAGQFAAKGKFTNNINSINLTGTADIQNLILTSPEGKTASEPKAKMQMNIDVDRESGDLEIKTLDFAASFGNAKIQNGYVPTGKKTITNLSLPATVEIDLHKVESFTRLSSAYPKKLILGGLLKSEINLSGNKPNYRITTNNTTIKNFSIATPDTMPLTQQLVSVNLDSQIGPSSKRIKCKLGGQQIKIDADLRYTVKDNNAALQAKADCDFNWQLVSRIISAVMPELKIEGQNKTNIELQSNYPADKPEQLWANLNVKPLKIGFDKAEYMGLVTSEPAQIEVKIDNGVLTIPQFSIKVNNGTLNFAGQADFKQTPTLLKTPRPLNIAQNLQIDERTTSALLKYINPIFADAASVSGVANFSCNALAIPLRGASKRDLLVDGTVSISNMKLGSKMLGTIVSVAGKSVREQQMQLRPTRIVVKDGLVRYDNMQLDVGDNPFNFVGRINLITRSIEGTKVITPYTLDDTIKIGEEKTRGRITGHFTGTYDRPEIDLGKTITDTLIQEGLEQLLKNL